MKTLLHVRVTYVAGALPLCQPLFQDGAHSFELEVAIKVLVVEEEWVPEYIIWPHLVIRHLTLIKPLRPHLCQDKEKLGEKRKKKDNFFLKRVVPSVSVISPEKWVVLKMWTSQIWGSSTNSNSRTPTSSRLATVTFTPDSSFISLHHPTNQWETVSVKIRIFFTSRRRL